MRSKKYLGLKRVRHHFIKNYSPKKHVKHEKNLLQNGAVSETSKFHHNEWNYKWFLFAEIIILSIFIKGTFCHSNYSMILKISSYLVFSFVNKLYFYCEYIFMERFMELWKLSLLLEQQIFTIDCDVVLSAIWRIPTNCCIWSNYSISISVVCHQCLCDNHKSRENTTILQKFGKSFSRFSPISTNINLDLVSKGPGTLTLS